MEEVFQLWLLYGYKNEYIFKDIKKLLTTGQKSHDEIIAKFLGKQLPTAPYPTLQIIHLLKNNLDFSDFYIYSTFEKYLQQSDIDCNDEWSKRVVNFLTNLNLSQELMRQIYENLAPLVFNKKLFLKNFLVYLSLAARDNHEFLQSYIQYEIQQLPVTSTKLVLHKAVVEREHIGKDLLQKVTTDEIKDGTIRNILTISGLIEMLNSTEEIFNERKRLYKQLKIINTEKLTPVQKIFYYDLLRIQNILKLHEKYPIRLVDVSTITKSNSVVDILLQTTNIISIGHEDIRLFIEKNQEICNKICGTEIKDNEADILISFYAMSSLCDYIFLDTKWDDFEEFAENILFRTKTVMRQIRDINQFSTLIENMFKLFFLRWEMLTVKYTSNGSNVSTTLSCTDETANPSNETSNRSNENRFLKRTSSKHGFICTKSIIGKLLNFLKNEVTKRYHTNEFQSASGEARERFINISDSINNGIWRLSLFEKLRHENDSAVRPFMPTLIESHAEIKPKTSSDDEGDESNKVVLIRRKPKAKKRPTSNQKEEESTQSGVSKLINKFIADMLGSDFKDDRSIVSKMLGSPENLAAVCLSIDDFTSAQQIIQTFNLKNKQLENEITLLKDIRQTKSKLEAIFEKYNSQGTSTTDSTTSTIELIKKVAALGFEASKITNIVEKFAQMNPLTSFSNSVYLIEKYGNNQKFLYQYKPGPIQATLVLDLILNLTNNYEITYNIFSMTERNYFANETKSDEDAYGTSADSTSSTIGCKNFFTSIVECLHYYKMISHQNFGLKMLLNDTHYSLRPNQLKIELEREKIFHTLYSAKSESYQTIDEMRGFSKYFDDLKSNALYFNKLVNYLTNLNHLLQLKDCEMALSVNELMAIDPKIIIGELIFDKYMTPLEIESIVTSLNFNLIHVIALNVCPEAVNCFDFVDNSKIKHRKSIQLQNQSIFNYIYAQNCLLSFLLRKVNDPKCDFSYKHKQYFTRYLALPAIEVMSEFFNGNLTTTGLLLDYIDNDFYENSLKFEIPIRMLSEIYDILKRRKASILDYVRNLEIEKAISADILDIHYLEHLTNINLYAEILTQQFTAINDSNFIARLIKHILSHRNINEMNVDLKEKLKVQLKHIRIFSKISELLNMLSWKSAYDLSMKAPDILINKLLNLREYKICYNWSEALNIPSTIVLKEKIVFDLFYEHLIETETSIDQYLLKLIESFPQEKVMAFYERNLERFRNLPVLKYVIKTLKEVCLNLREKCLSYEVSLIIFKYLPAEERDQNWNLIDRPLLLIEQIIMNSKFALLKIVITEIKRILGDRECKFCFNKRGSSYDMPMTSSATLGSDCSSEFILHNFDLYKKDHTITIECIDLILRTYATKALDYGITEAYSSTEVLQSTSISIDSLYGSFVMPKDAPTKENWIKDEDALLCMCCKRANFTMFTRRHHCRRCGRVICRACSTNRMKIPSLYDQVLVRVCDECVNQTQIAEVRNAQKPTVESPSLFQNKFEQMEWQFSGTLTHDKLLREEFCYEHAPNAGLSLSILDLHHDNEECVNFLLHHCRKLEKLLRPLQPGVPNPEIDYALVAKMLTSLALAAKVRGGPTDYCDILRDHSEIIVSIVKNDCETLLPMEELKNETLRKLGDSLVVAEKWNLALDIFFKCGFPTAGVMAAHGLSCLKAGCFETAREKFHHCMTKISSESDNKTILKKISSDTDSVLSAIEIPIVKRPNRSPPLLSDIIKIIETTSESIRPETLVRASIVKRSNSSLASTNSKRRENIPIYEPALNILNTLSNLKQISQGNYSCDSTFKKLDNENFAFKNSRLFEECSYYLLMYGSHADIIHFLIRHEQLQCALKYFVLQHLEGELFVQTIFQKYLRIGKMDLLIKKMIDLDGTLLVWKETLIHTCRYLETKNLLNTLYHMQILLKDPIRASMTCVKFYSMNCTNFRDLHNNVFHLVNARDHLQTELELCPGEWENISVKKRRHSNSMDLSFFMYMDSKTLNTHINTIQLQMEVTKFLARYEREGVPTMEILKQISLDSSGIPTLFNSVHDKIKLCILILLCGRNIEEGFGLVFRIIQGYKLSTIKVYGTTAKYLSRHNRIGEVEKLINCIKSNNGRDSQHLIEEVLTLSIQAAANTTDPSVRTTLDSLIKSIADPERKISCYIFVGQLKSAYLLAVQYNRINDVRRILKQAETTNQVHVKRMCEKKLNISSTSK